MDRANSVIGRQYLQRLATTGQRLAQSLNGGFDPKSIERQLIDSGQTTELTERPVIQLKLAGRADRQTQLAIIHDCGSHRIRWFPAIDGMFLQRAAVLIELVKGFERLIRRSGKQFAGSPHKIGHGTISKQDPGKQKNRK